MSNIGEPRREILSEPETNPIPEEPKELPAPEVEPTKEPVGV